MAALAPQAAGQASSPRVLAAVPVDGRLEALPYPVHAHLTGADGSEVALVVVEPPRLALAPRGRALSPAALASEFVVGLERRPGARKAARSLAEVVFDDGRHVVARASAHEAEALGEAGLDLERLRDEPMAMAAAVPPAVTSTAADPTIAGIVAGVTQTAVYEWTAGLTGVQPVTVEGASYTITTRATASGTPIAKATQYAYERMQSFGLATSFHAWTGGPYSGRNVVGELPGTSRPSEIVVVCAHLDDRPSSGPAPGADDNASGSVAVLLAAQLLSGHGFERTIRFVLFTGEEQGLYGSSAYAGLLAGQGANVVAVLNLDMIAWDGTGQPILRLHTRTSSSPGHAGDLAIASLFASAVTDYVGGALVPLVTADGETASDHSSFWSRGWPGILAIEDDYGDFNPNYHQAKDTLASLNLPYFTSFVQASVATAAHLALLDAACPAAATIAGPPPVCAGDPADLVVTLTGGSGPFSVVVNGVAHTFGSSPASLTVSPAATTTYTLTSVTANGCTNAASASTTVDVLPRPSSPSAGSNSPVPAGGTLTLTASTVAGATGYSWTGPNGFTSTLQSPSIPNVAAAAAGTYSVVAWRDGCASPPASTSVSVVPPPAATIAGSPTICAGQAATLTVTLTSGTPPFRVVVNGVTYDLGSSPALLTVSPWRTTSYTITSVTAGGVTNAAGGSGTATVSVTSTLCLNDAGTDLRWRADVTWSTTQGGGDGAGRPGWPIPTASVGVRRGGLFWFFHADNPEVLLKVLNGCAVNGRYWVFLSAGTNVGLTATVTDAVTGSSRSYRNEDGTPAAPVQDTTAFPCGAPAALGGAPDAPATAAQKAPATPQEPPAAERSAFAACTPSSSTLCLDGASGDRRFRVVVDYETAQGGGLSGSGRAISTSSLGVLRGGLFWFFSPDNPEMLVKVLDGCAVNGKRWVFASAGTNVGTTTTVTDTVTGEVRSYSNPDLTPAVPVQDTAAFDCGG